MITCVARSAPGPPTPGRGTNGRRVLVRTPSADIVVHPSLVDHLIATQHPDLAGATTPVANGWDNALYRLGDGLVVRLPRRQVAVEPLRNEQRWLPVLAERVDVSIPVPVRVGEPNAEYPWPWTISRWFDGRLACDVPALDRVGAAVGLAGFVAGLHAPAPLDAPRSPVRGVPLADRDPVVRERLAGGAVPHAGALLALWDEAVGVSAWSGAPRWVHGDLHPANMLLSATTGELTAVLDFGDLTAGDPATDLAVAWLMFDEAGRAAFRAEVDRLTGTEVDTWRRAHGWALNLATMLVEHSSDNPRMAAIGAHGLDQIVDDQ